MKNPEAAALPRNWRQVFNEQADILEDSFKGAYGLGVTFEDIKYALGTVDHRNWVYHKIFAENNLAKIALDKELRRRRSLTKRPVLSESRPFIAAYSVAEKIKESVNVLSDDQKQAVNQIAHNAARDTGVAPEIFTQGYSLYISMALRGDKLPSGFNLDFKDIMQTSNIGSEPARRLFELEQLSHNELPLMNWLVESYPSAFNEMPNSSNTVLAIDPTFHPRMILAGVGLAYEHCLSLVQDSESAARVEYFSANGINPMGLES